MLTVRPSLAQVDVLCEVSFPAAAGWQGGAYNFCCPSALQINDTSTVIPRNSIVEANQSGLIAEPLLDVTPQVPLPTWQAGPHEAGCADEASIVCEHGRCAAV